MGQSSGGHWSGHGKMVSLCRTLAHSRGWDGTGLDTKKYNLVRGGTGGIRDCSGQKKTPQVRALTQKGDWEGRRARAEKPGGHMGENLHGGKR